jgi:hypothetical protein
VPVLAARERAAPVLEAAETRTPIEALKVLEVPRCT